MEGKQDQILSTLEKQNGRIGNLEAEQGKIKTRLAWYAGFGAAFGFIIAKGASYLKFFT